MAESWHKIAIELYKQNNSYEKTSSMINSQYNLCTTPKYIQHIVGLDLSSKYELEDTVIAETIEKEGFEERKPKYYDDGDKYIIHTAEGKKQDNKVIITKDNLRELKKLYCDIVQPLSINQICRTLQMSRKHFFIIKTAFCITHDDIPYIDEDVLSGDINNMVVDTLESKKDKFFVKLQQQEFLNLKNELIKYRKKDYLLEKMYDLSSNILEDMDAIITTSHKRRIYPKKGNLMLEVPIMDLHLNKLAWNQETGEDYDSKIAKERFEETVYEILDRVKDKPYEKIIFPLGNDFFNIDSSYNTTTAGTPQDADSRWCKMWTLGVQLLIWAIDKLATIAPIYVFLVPGNHDATTSFYAINTIQAYYKDDENVTIDTNPMSRKYVRFGVNLLGFTHLDKEGKRIMGNMQQEAPEAWGKSKYREWHGGHLHSEQVIEASGIHIRNLSSPTGTDAWHFLNGYTGAVARTEIFEWDKLRGLINIGYVTIERTIKSHIIEL